jgi:hypothetical protein
VAKPILIDELRVTLLVPRGLRLIEYDAIRRALDAPEFWARFRRAVRGAVRADAALAKVRVAVTR